MLLVPLFLVQQSVVWSALSDANRKKLIIFEATPFLD